VTWLAIVNPAAGGGRARRRAPAALEALRSTGASVDVVETTHAGHAIELARAAYRAGRRHFVAVGGDGTSWEVVNGLFPDARGDEVTLGLLPLGTGNSFLRDFSQDGAKDALDALVAGRRRPVDLVCMTHEDGHLFSLNILSIGFVADICVTANRRFKAFGQASYVFGVFAELARLRPDTHSLVIDGQPAERPSTFVSFNNSQFTGGAMHMAPGARTDDGTMSLIEVAPMGRLELLRTFPKIFAGTHVTTPKVTERQVTSVRFARPNPVDVMVDGEVLTVTPSSIDVWPGALQVCI
jgi:YegS/Rv2252/BmrU family lipid kinase